MSHNIESLQNKFDLESVSIRDQKKVLRRFFRDRRQNFTGRERQQSELAIINEISAILEKITSGWIAVYYPFDGEVNLSSLWGGEYPLIQTEKNHLQTHSDNDYSSLINRLVFPVHESGKALQFVRPTSWKIGKSGLAQAQGPNVNLDELGVIFVPSVAFCKKTGKRLGLGGGHYDRTLILREENSWTLPTFGVGFSFQQHSPLPSEPWDIPLDGLISELGLHIPT